MVNALHVTPSPPKGQRRRVMRMLEAKDLSIDIKSLGTLGSSVWMRIIHIPSGEFVEGEGKIQHHLRRRLMDELTRKTHEWAYPLSPPPSDAKQNRGGKGD